VTPSETVGASRWAGNNLKHVGSGIQTYDYISKQMGGGSVEF